MGECSWLQAEDAASQALYQNPKLLKARYRRGLARKEQGDYVIAIGGTSGYGVLCFGSI